MAVLAAGWPVEAPGVTLNRFCGSGQQAVTFAAMGIQAGHQQLVVAGGVESMSRWPFDDAPPDFTSGNAALREMHPLVPQGISADLIATIEGLTREDVDRFAVASQDRAARAMAEGRFDRSVVPIVNPDGSVADVPGWILNSDGFWILDPSDEILRQGISLTYEVNPTAGPVLVTYPPESSACANPDGPFPPGTPVVPPGIVILPPTR